MRNTLQTMETVHWPAHLLQEPQSGQCHSKGPHCFLSKFFKCECFHRCSRTMLLFKWQECISPVFKYRYAYTEGPMCGSFPHDNTFQWSFIAGTSRAMTLARVKENESARGGRRLGHWSEEMFCPLPRLAAEPIVISWWWPRPHLLSSHLFSSRLF